MPSTDTTDRRAEHIAGLVRDGIARLRLKLLDLTNRNRLLNYKFSENSRKAVRIVDEVPDQLYKKLLDEAQTETKLYFVGLPNPPADQFEKSEQEVSEIESSGGAVSGRRGARRPKVNAPEWARHCGIDPSYDLPSTGTDRVAHNDNQIQTLLVGDDLQSRLAAIREEANLTQQEVGLSTLHAAFGYLEWYEADQSDEPRYAPLVLVPVVLDRELQRSTYRYFIKSGESSDPTINLTLRERLTRDFGIVLPELETDELPENYCKRVERLVEQHKRWKVRRQAVVGHFSFARLAMYQDLAPEAWATAPIENLSLISSLIAGQDHSDSIGTTDFEPDSEEAHKQVPILVTDADSSQFSALIDAMQGRSFALKGPPGTGKSQTITNLIAAALSKGKRVLFVAEKMAALNVVSDRLGDAGLGDYILELHSTKAKKKQVLESFEKRLNSKPAGDETVLKNTVIHLKKTRDELRQYVHLMNTSVGETGLTLHEIYWQEQRARRGVPDTVFRKLLGVSVNDPSAISSDEFADRCSAFAQFATYWEKCRQKSGDISTHPLRGIQIVEDESSTGRVLANSFSKIKTASEQARRVLEHLGNAFKFQPDDRLVECERLVTSARDLASHRNSANAAILRMITTKADVNSLIQLASQLEELLSGFERFESIFVDTDLILSEADRLKMSASGLHERLSAIRMGEKFVLPMTNELDIQDQKLSDVKSTLEVLAQFCRGVKIEGGIDLPLARSLQKAAALLNEISEITLNARSADLYQPEAEVKLEEFAAQSRSIQQSFKKLSLRLDLEQLEPKTTLRQYAYELKSKSAITGFFSSTFRAAKRHFRMVSRGGKTSRKDIASLFLEAATTLGNKELFEESADLRVLAGKQFRGLETSFENLLSVVKFHARVRAEFSALRPGEEAVGKALLAGDTNLLIELARALNVDSVQGFDSWKSTIGDRAVASLLDHIVKEISVLRAAKTLAMDLSPVQVRRTITLTQFRSALELGRRLNTDWKQIAQHPALAALKTPVARPTIEALTTLRDTLAYADRVLEQHLDPAIQASLLTNAYEVKLSSFVGFASLLREATNALQDLLGEATEQHGLRLDAYCPENRSRLKLAMLDTMADQIIALEPHEISEWVRMRRLRLHAVQKDMQPLIGLIEDQAIDANYAEGVCKIVHYRSLIGSAHKKISDLPDWTGEKMSTLRAKSARLDLEYMNASRKWLAWSLAQKEVPRGNSSGSARELTDCALIRREIGKQKKHVAVRDLLARAGGAARALKPCFMMSPASVAQFLSPATSKFDIVVIDEASQMRPEEAIGAIARAEQAIVVGDPMQLPPTSFFDSSEHDQQDDENGEKADIDTESVLDLALSAWQPNRELNWHYRSQHHSLIAFSNREFYNDRLVVFPSPSARSSNLGVELIAVTDGIYASSINEREVQEVVAYVERAIRANPGSSIGVVAVNQPQKDLLLERFDRAFAEDSILEAYRDRWAATLEPFMVKNLENVQGDERDVIVISTVYGPAALGERPMQRFGPINSKMGHRRLNVLFTRAKQKVAIVSSLKPEDILVQASSSLGVKALKGYLEYARSGRLDRGAITGGSYDSPFEKEVADTIRELGYQVESQIGVAGYFLDLAVRHPSSRDHFVLGIECDGAAFHSARSARDRDRLREGVLKRLGWDLHRIWSTDWFVNRQREVQRLDVEIQAAVRRAEIN